MKEEHELMGARSEAEPGSPSKSSAKTPAGFPSDPSRVDGNDGFTRHGYPMDGRWNWVEHYPDDNGQYVHGCSCGRTFYGHKRQIDCKVCATLAEQYRKEAEAVMENYSELVWSIMGLSNATSRALFKWGYIDGYVKSAFRARNRKGGEAGPEGTDTPEEPGSAQQNAPK